MHQVLTHSVFPQAVVRSELHHVECMDFLAREAGLAPAAEIVIILIWSYDLLTDCNSKRRVTSPRILLFRHFKSFACWQALDRPVSAETSDYASVSCKCSGQP